MEAILIHPNSKADMRLLMSFSKRIGATAHILSESELEEREDVALAAIMDSRITDEYVSHDEIMEILKR